MLIGTVLGAVVLLPPEMRGHTPVVQPILKPAMAIAIPMDFVGFRAITELTDVDTVQMFNRRFLRSKPAQATRTSNMWITTCRFANLESGIADRRSAIADLRFRDFRFGNFELDISFWKCSRCRRFR